MSCMLRSRVWKETHGAATLPRINVATTSFASLWSPYVNVWQSVRGACVGRCCAPSSVLSFSSSSSTSPSPSTTSSAARRRCGCWCVRSSVWWWWWCGAWVAGRGRRALVIRLERVYSPATSSTSGTPSGSPGRKCLVYRGRFMLPALSLGQMFLIYFVKAQQQQQWEKLNENKRKGKRSREKKKAGVAVGDKE